MQAAVAAASRVDSIIAAGAAADNEMTADATVVEAHVTATAEASTALTLVQAAAARRDESVMVAEAAADNALNADAIEVEAYVPTTAEVRTALTLVQAAAAASRVDSIIAAEAATDNELHWHCVQRLLSRLHSTLLATSLHRV